MATTITSQPANFGLTKNFNQMVFGISSDKYIQTAGVKSSYNFSFNTNPSVGETLIVDAGFLTDPITYTYVAGAPADCTEITLGADAAETTQNTWEAFQKNYILANAYLLPDSLVYTARETGAEYDLSYTGTASGDLNASVGTAGVTELVRDDLRIIVDVFTTDGSTNERVLSLSIPPEEDGSIEIDIQEALLSYLSPDKPNYNSTASELASGPILQYFIRHTDYYDSEYHCYEQSDTLRAVLAGYPERLLYGNQFSADYFTDNAARKFLTRIPRGFLKLPSETQFYLYHWVGTSKTYKLGVQMSYDDGTSSISYNMISRNTSNGLIIWPAGYSQLDLDSLKTAGKTIKYYEVFVIDEADIGSSTILTELFKISVDYTVYESNRYFMYLNSLGGMDVAFFSGNREKKIRTQGLEYDVYTPEHDEETVNAEFKSGIKTFVNPSVYYHGYTSVEYLDYLQELLKSELIYELKDGQFIEMKMISDELELYTDRSDQFEYKIEMMPAQIERGYAS